MKNKRYIATSIAIIFCLILITGTLIYIYVADRLDPNLLNYYASDNSDNSETGVISKIVRNSKALIGKKGSQYIRHKFESRYLKTSLSEEEIIERFLHGNTPMSITWYIFSEPRSKLKVFFCLNFKIFIKVRNNKKSIFFQTQIIF